MARTRSKRRTRHKSARTSARMLRTLGKTVKHRKRVARTRRRKYRGGSRNPKQPGPTHTVRTAPPPEGLRNSGSSSDSEEIIRGMDLEQLQKVMIDDDSSSDSSVSSDENLRDLEIHVRGIHDKAILKRILGKDPNLLEYASVSFRSEMDVCKSALNSIVENNLSPQFINIAGLTRDECKEIIRIISGSTKLDEFSVLSCLSKIVYFYPGLFNNLNEKYRNYALIVDGFIGGISRLNVARERRDFINTTIDNAFLSFNLVDMIGTPSQIEHVRGKIEILKKWKNYSGTLDLSSIESTPTSSPTSGGDVNPVYNWGSSQSSPSPTTPRSPTSGGGDDNPMHGE